MQKKLLNLIYKTLGTDFHTLATLISRGWSILANGLTMLLIPIFMSSIDQGYYYTFISLIGLQILFELGLGQVIMQLVGHDIAHLKYHDNSHLSGDERKINHLGSLMRLLKYWYIIAAVLFALIAGLGGIFFLANNNHALNYNWIYPWVIIVLATAINLSFLPELSFLEGCGQIGQVAKMRLQQSVLASIFLWIMLILDFGLWAVCVVPFVNCIYTFLWLKKYSGVFDWLLIHTKNKNFHSLNWYKDIFPFQWRIALSSLSGYFIFYAFIPIIFAKSGAVEAGKFGIAIAIFNALGTVGSSWTHAKTPLMAMLISRGERKELNLTFNTVIKKSLIFTIISIAIILSGVMVLNSLQYSLASRIAEFEIMLCLSLVAISNCIIFGVAAYMRAHKEEPMLPVSLFGAVATLLIAHFTAHQNLFLLSILYAFLTSCILLPWSLFLFSKYRRI
jgi:O-antigen/teichoic acid export membrane protein